MNLNKRHSAPITGQPVGQTVPTDPTFGNMELYDTMVVHYDKENNSVPDMVQRAKQDELMRKGLRINKTQTAKQKRMEKRRRSEPRPASQNPNYQYNKTIDVKRKSVDGHLDHKKAQAQERIRMMNDRLRNINNGLK